MKKFKYLIAFLLVAVLMLGACSNTNQDNSDEATESVSEAALSNDDKDDDAEDVEVKDAEDAEIEDAEEVITDSDKEIVIGSKPMPEGIILGEMLALLVEENTDIAVERQFELGATPILHEAILNSEIDIYPEYTGTGWLSILNQEPVQDSTELFNQVKSAYEEEFNLTWSPMIGFNNTYTIIVNNATAEEYNLETISDLAEVSDQLIFGANGDFFERADGFPYVEEEYGMNFKETTDIDIGLKYQACVEDEIQATTAFTTDGYLSENKVKSLQDDKQIFAIYDAAFVLRQEILDEYPELVDVLELTKDLINDQEMQKLNYAAQVEGKAHEQIAKDYLLEKGLIN
ncbi:MAG: glycine/betaine ABC transporter substrate-binding protein [Clostridiaceae bacterium]|nr:glycine/betaine ABC transporter substrate-binding protein [Clostridiaceae bacterium]